MPVKLKKETVTHWISGKSLQWQLKKKKQKKKPLCFQEWLPFQWSIYNKTQLCIHKQNEAEDEKKKIHDILNRSLWVGCLTAAFPSEQV